MSKSCDNFWGVPEKMKKLFEGQGESLPEIHFLFTVNENNVNHLLKENKKLKIVLLTLFPEEDE